MADAGFEKWMGRVDQLVLKRIGVGADDIADMPWHDWYDDEMTPSQAARLAIEEAS